MTHVLLNHPLYHAYYLRFFVSLGSEFPDQPQLVIVEQLLQDQFLKFLERWQFLFLQSLLQTSGYALQ